MAEAKKAVKNSTKVEVIESKPVKKAAAKKVKNEIIKKEVSNGHYQESSASQIQADDQGQNHIQAVTTAKAGKRSAKAQKEAEEKRAKAERKTKASDAKAEAKPKTQQPVRTRLERRGKNYRKAAEQIDKTKVYELQEAIDTVIKTSPVKFDATVEMHLNLHVDPRQADQNVRGTVVLPAGTGKSQRVAVFGEADDVAAAKKAGADIAGGDEFLQQLDKGQLNFDILIASPKVMVQLGKYAKLLGPKGLMPNPKSGTVATDIAKAVTEAKAGKVEYRVDSTGIIHSGIGKVSFGTDKLLQNAEALLGSIKNAKPASIKGIYIRSGFLTTTMGPSLRITI